MTTHPYAQHRLRPAQPRTDDDPPESTVITALERVHDGRVIHLSQLRRLTARRLAHRHPLASLDLPMVADLTPRGHDLLTLVWARRSRLTLALLVTP